MITLPKAFSLLLLLWNTSPTTTAPYRIIDLGTLGGELATACAVNNRGDIVGESEVRQTAVPFLWRNGAMREILGLSSNNDGRALDVNEAGEIVGFSMAKAPIFVGYVGHAFYWNESLASPVDLTPTEDSTSQGEGVNDDGQVAGAINGGRNAGAYVWTVGPHYRVAATRITGFGAPQPMRVWAHDINNDGLVVGGVIRADLNDAAYVYRTSDAALLELQSLGGTHGTQLGGQASQAWGINDRGDIVGESIAPDYRTHPALWLRQGSFAWAAPVDMGLLPDPYDWGGSEAINNYGQVVGWSTSQLSGVHSKAWLWDDGVLTALIDLLPNEDQQHWELTGALDINDAGWIVGAGIHDGIPGRAFLMIPNTNTTGRRHGVRRP